MNEFKAGDRVVRVQEVLPVHIRDNNFMQIGEEYTVSKEDHGCLYLVGSDAWYRPFNFELVEATKTTEFKEMKFYVNSSEQARDVQEALFSLGYEWASGCKNVLYRNDTGFLVTSKSGAFSLYDEHYNYGVVARQHLQTVQEYTLNVKKTYEIVPVEVKEETIEILGQLYSKKELEATLLNLKPIPKES